MSITFPRGFIANGIHSGVKKEGLDLGLLLSTCNASASGMFTTNQVKSPSVIITGERLKSGLLRGIIANSGCAMHTVISIIISLIVWFFINIILGDILFTFIDTLKFSLYIKIS